MEELTAYHGIKIPEIFNNSVPSTPLQEDTPVDNSLSITVDQIQSGDVLDRDLTTTDGYLLFPALTVMSDARINQLFDLNKLAELSQIWIKQV
jgi:hypothetical protein